MNRIFLLLFSFLIISFVCAQQNNNFSINCDIDLSPPTSTNLCNGEWFIQIVLEGDLEAIAELVDVSVIYTDLETGFAINPPSENTYLDPLSPLTIFIDATLSIPGSYLISFENTGSCNLGAYEIQIPNLSNPNFSSSIDSPLCNGEEGVFTGFLSDVVGIYQYYIDGEYIDDISVGIQDLQFDAWVDNDSFDCESGVAISGDVSNSQSIALNNVSGLDIGDIIGAFFMHPTCGLTNVGSGIYTGSVVPVTIWGDDVTTEYFEGPSNGDEIIWLVLDVSADEVYDVEVVFDSNFPTDGNYFTPMGLSASTSFSPIGTYEDAFEINLPEGTYDFTLQDGNCVLFSESIIIDPPFSVDDFSVEVVDSECSNQSEGSITFVPATSEFDFILQLISVTNPDDNFIAPEGVLTFNNLAPSDYILLYEETNCNENNFVSVSVGSEATLDGPCDTCENGEVTDNDQDNDGICDDDEIIGCIDAVACNYDSNATEACVEIIDNFTFIGLDNISSYYISNIQATWEDANNICNTLGGHLASIESQEEQDFIFLNVNNILPNNYWIGFNDVSVEGDFVWTNGQEVTYTNWNVDEPNGFGNENYVEVFSQNAVSPGFWNDAPGDVLRYYVLEIESALDCCVYVENVCDTCEAGVVVDNDIDDDGICDIDEVPGCTNPLYEEYDPLATDDNGSCLTLSLDGCIDASACNYNPEATIDDGSCVFIDDVCETCEAGLVIGNDIDNDGVCDNDEVTGCGDSQACNFNALATDDDGSCVFIDGICETCSGETDGTGTIVDNDLDDDGVCNDDEIFGCTDSNALNYNPLATEDNGSCIEFVYGCTDPLAENYNPNANNSDDSCVYLPLEINYSLSDNILFATSSTNNGVLEVDAVLDCGSIGEIEIQASGGVPGTYVYNWFEDIEDVTNSIINNQIESVLSNVSEGFYCVQVSDVNAAESNIICFDIIEDTSFIQDIIVDQPACLDDVGSIQIILDNQYVAEDLTILWYYDTDGDGLGDNLLTDGLETVFNLPALNDEWPNFEGGYYLTISNGTCTEDTLININPGQDLVLLSQEPSLFLDTVSLNPLTVNQYEIDCFGSTNAEMSLLFAGGQPPYDLYVDVNGVSGLVASDITINQSGPIFSYTYDQFYDLWDGPNGEIPIESIEANYQFIIIAADGNCSVLSDVFEYNQPDELEVFVETTTDCFDVNNNLGQLSVEASGGVLGTPYTIKIDNDGDGDFNDGIFGSAQPNTESVFDLPSGFYDIQIEDDFDCILYTSAEILANSPIDVSWSGGFNCPGNLDAFFDIDISGGTPPYTYQWIGDFGLITDESEDGSIQFNNLPNGDYYFTVQDAENCYPFTYLGDTTSLELFTFSVSEVAPIEINYSISDSLECYGDSSLDFDLSITQNEEQGDISNTFTVLLDSMNITIDTLDLSPTSLDLDFCFPALNNGISQSIIANSSGLNLGGVTFVPFSTNMEEDDVFGFFNLVDNDLNPSGYQCVGGIQGGDICAEEGTTTFNAPLAFSQNAFIGDNLSFITWFEELSTPNLGVLSSSNDFYVDNNVYGFVLRDDDVYEAEVNFATVNVQGQVFVDNYLPNTFMYIESIIVADAPYGCSSCGDSIIFSISNPSFEDEYVVNVIDQYGCTQSIDIDFPAPQEPIVSSVFTVDELSCADSSDGAVGVNISGGYGFYNVQLFSQSVNIPIESVLVELCPTESSECDDVFFTNLSQGDYVIQILDDLGCEFVSNFSVDAPNPIVLNYNYQNVSCNPANSFGGEYAGPNVSGSSSNGLISMEISGGLPPYNILIENQDEEIFIAQPIDTSLFTYTYEVLDLIAGTYFISIQDSNGCEYEYQDSSGLIQQIHSVEILNPDSLIVIPTITPIDCYNGQGDIELLWSGGTPFLIGSPYQYIQPTGVDPDGVNTLITINNSFNQTGYFAEEALDANGCSCFFEVVMTQPEPIELVGDINTYMSDYNGFATSCSGASDGQIGVDPPIEISGGIGPFSFNWSLVLSNGTIQSINPTLFGDSETSLDGIPAGTYVLEVSDNASEPEPCVLPIEFVLDQPDILGVSPSESQVSMNIDLENGWPQDIVLDSFNDQLSIYGEYGVSCFGANNGFIDIDVAGGTGEYNFSWSADVGSDGFYDFFSNSEDLSNLQAGTYTVVVTDDNYIFNNETNCSVTQTYILEETLPLEVDLSVSYYEYNSPEVLTNIVSYQEGDSLEYNISCYGSDDGMIYVSQINGGTGTYFYELNFIDSLGENAWSISGNLEDINDDFLGLGGYVLSGLGPGNYLFSIYDSNYEFLSDNWDNFSSPLNYNACIFEMPVVLNEPNEIFIEEDHSEYHSNSDFVGFGVSCYGASDGYINVFASGGEGLGLKFNYEYSWYGIIPGGDDSNPSDYIDLNGQGSSPILNGIPAGNYFLDVIDSRDCIQSLVIEITSPPAIEFDINQPTDYNENICFDISCFGEDDAFINASSLVADAGAGFSYIWTLNNDTLNQSGSYIDNLGPGYYYLFIEDNLTSCEEIYGPIYISEPNLLYSSIDNIFISDFDGVLGDNDYNGYSVSCPNSNDGLIGVEVQGGSGLYNVQVLDNDGNVIGDVFDALDPQPCEVDLLVDLDIDGDGILNQYDSDIDGDGIYDTNGVCVSNCNSNITYDIEGNCVLNCQNNDLLPYYAGDGSLIIEIDGLSAGIYSLVISDANCPLIENCSCESIFINDVELTSPPEILQAEIIELDSVSCYGLADGSMIAEFFGGLPDSWNWGFYETDSLGMYNMLDMNVDNLLNYGVNLFEPSQISIGGLSAGFYRLDIYDVNGFFVSDMDYANLGLSAPLEYLFFNEGCMASLPIQINQPPAIDSVSVNLIHPCFNDSSGVISLDLIGENPPFEVYLESDLVANFVGVYDNSIEVINLPSGSYTVSVIDSNNCSEEFEFELGWNYTDLEDVSSEFIIVNNDQDGDGIYDNINIPECEFSFDGYIGFPEVVNDNNPDFTYSFFWEANPYIDGQEPYVSYEDSLVDIPVGVYTLNIIDDVYGCVVTFEYDLDVLTDCPEIPTGFSPNGDGINDYWVVGGLNQYVDAEVSVYNRWGQRVFYSRNNREYWDGKYQGKDMPMADYFYIINNSDGDNLKHGRVTLRR